MTIENYKKFVINLKRREDRLQKLSLPFNYEVFEATDGKQKYPEIPRKLKGVYGCYDSHLRLIQKIKDENIKNSIIFEDDVELSKDFIYRFNKSINELPNDWDILYLGGWNLGDKKKFSENLDIAEKVFTTQSYMVNFKFIETLLEIIKIKSGKIDVIFSDILPKYKCFICSPPIAWQMEGFSDIENKLTNNIHLR
jgi:GR25 family glycosyltransferase involved in LPS biosynthesis